MNKPERVLKLLAIGDVCGRIEMLLKRINAVQKKSGPFDMALCVGEFFNDDDQQGVIAQDFSLWSDLTSGKVSFPLPAYILGPVKDSQSAFYPDLNGCELAENLVYLGKSGCLKTNEGLTIAYLSELSLDLEKTINTMKARTGCDLPSFKGVDIFMTSEWPSGITENAPEGFVAGTENDSSRILVAHLAGKLKPRYHFSGLRECFYERLPYRNHKVLNEPASHVTRFIALAKVGNVEKRKWMYAFNIVPIALMPSKDLNAQPPNVTEFPFEDGDLDIAKRSTSAINPFFYSSLDESDKDRRKRKGGGGGGEECKKSNREPPKVKGPCWFCLSSAEVEKHLVVSIGTHSYLALAKGGMVPHHVMVLPIAHHPSSLELPDEVSQEMDKFKSALKKCFKKELGGQVAVFFERNFRSSHLQLQVVPVPKDASTQLGITVQECAEEQELELTQVPEHANLSQMAEPSAPYFYIEMGSKVRYFHRVRGKFPMQFGREVLAHRNLLDVHSRIDWRECKTDKETETQLTQSFRRLFQAYDFTLDDDNV